MKVVIVTSGYCTDAMVINAPMSHKLLGEIASAFLAETKTVKPGTLRHRLRKVFGRWNFKKFAVEHREGGVCRVTFSILPEPEFMYYRRGPVAIASKHAARFDLILHETDLFGPTEAP